MSDRVWFATRKVTNQPLVFTSSSFNGFPFRTPEYASESLLPTEGTTLIKVPRLTAVKWAWRVKEWTVDISFGANGENVSGDSWSDSWTATALMGPGSETDYTAITRERQKCRQWVSAMTTYVSGSSDLKMVATGDNIYITNYPDGVPCFVGDMIGWPSAPISWLRANDDEIYLPVTMSWALESDGAGGSTFAIVFANDSLSPYDGSFTANVDGVSVPMRWYNYGPDPAFATGISVTITPSAYWPYAASDGSPIYNTSTGALLQDPRN